MPCWYFERKEIKYSPSFNEGVDSLNENRYRREGARFIIDAGTKMGLRYDTCATGVVYFHRFYMFHSFKEYYRYVTAACCLLLAGKVEETPKKCRDIIRIAQSLLSASSFAHFGEDPREEVMAMERVLLKTIKFDFQVDHPYGCMLKYAKLFKGDKEKTQKMAQMAWTFINDSLCTTLSLQWEPEIIAVSLMYLASRLTKFEPSEWSGRTSSKSKWWEDIIEGMSMELMEDICHQVLDLYSSKQKKAVEADSPPQSPAKGSQQSSPPPPPPPDKTPVKRTRESTPSESERPLKSSKTDGEGSHISIVQSKPSGAPIPVAQHIPSTAAPTGGFTSADPAEGGGGGARRTGGEDYASFNPYVSSQMYSSSFMSLEGSQNIQSILAGNAPPSSSASGGSGGGGPPANSSSSAPAASMPPYTDPHPHHAGHHDMSAGQYSAPPHHGQHLPDQQYGGYPPAQTMDPSAYSYPSLPQQQPSQYGSHLPPTSAASSMAPPPHQTHYPQPPAAPTGLSTYDPYNMAPPNPAASYHGGPPGVYQPPPLAAGQSNYPQQTLPPPQGYPSAPYYPPSMGGPPPGMGQSSYPPSTYPPQPGSAQGMHGHSRPPHNFDNFGLGGHSRHRGNFQKQKQNQRSDIPALTDVKISGRPDWGHQN